MKTLFVARSLTFFDISVRLKVTIGKPTMADGKVRHWDWELRGIKAL